MPETQNRLIVYAVVIFLAVLLMGLRLTRMKRARSFKPDRLWILPLVLVFFASISLVQFPPQGPDGLWLVVAAVAGAGFGWQRGRMMDIKRDPETGIFTTRASPMAVYFLVGLVVIRLAFRTGLQMEAQNGGVSAGFVSNVSVIFVAALFSAQRLEMALRARRLLAGR